MYQRIETTDHVTVMNKALYDNLQDGIDELRGELGMSNSTSGGGTGETPDNPSGESIRDILSSQTLLLSELKFSMESILKGFEEKFGGGLYMKNWKVEVNEDSVVLGSYSIIAPEDSFLLFYHCWQSVNNLTLPALSCTGNEDFTSECILNFSKYFRTQGYDYPIVVAFFLITCKKGDLITLSPSPQDSSSRPIKIVSIY